MSSTWTSQLSTLTRPESTWITSFCSRLSNDSIFAKLFFTFLPYAVSDTFSLVIYCDLNPIYDFIASFTPTLSFKFVEIVECASLKLCSISFPASSCSVIFIFIEGSIAFFHFLTISPDDAILFFIDIYTNANMLKITKLCSDYLSEWNWLKKMYSSSIISPMHKTSFAIYRHSVWIKGFPKLQVKTRLVVSTSGHYESRSLSEEYLH